MKSKTLADRKYSGINVAHLKYYNLVLLILTACLFIVTTFDPHYYLIVIATLAILGSFFITFADYYKELFTADPQKISMLKGSAKPFRLITITPYILDKRSLSVYAKSIAIEISPNYSIIKVDLNGRTLKQAQIEHNKTFFVVDEQISAASKFVVELEEKEVEVASRYLTFFIYYNKKKTSKFLRFKEIHTID